MELGLGRRLETSESVHHIDYDKTNNDLSNLRLMGRGEHSSHHRHLDVAFRERDELGRFASGGGG